MTFVQLLPEGLESIPRLLRGLLLNVKGLRVRLRCRCWRHGGCCGRRHVQLWQSNNGCFSRSKWLRVGVDGKQHRR